MDKLDKIIEVKLQELLWPWEKPSEMEKELEDEKGKPGWRIIRKMSELEGFTERECRKNLRGDDSFIKCRCRAIAEGLHYLKAHLGDCIINECFKNISEETINHKNLLRKDCQGII